MSVSAVSRRHAIRPALDRLDDRVVPSATVVDLTGRGSAGAANGALLRQCDAQPTGTGVIRSFVRVQGNGVEQGYNTDARPLQFDENKSPQFTRSLTLGQVPTVTVDGVAYREFLLDINQKSSSPLLSLDELRLYVGTAPNLTGYNATAKTLAGLAPLYDLDGAGDVTVKMDYRLNSGSGSGDIFVLVPDAAFAGQPAGGFVYLYSKFGGTWAANSGFEEWAVRVTPETSGGGTTPPPTGLSSLSGYVYQDVDRNLVMNTGDAGIAGIVIQLQGVNDLGQTVVLTTTTGSNGFFKFDGLRPGTYSVFRTSDPVSNPNFQYIDSANNVGTVNGVVTGTDHPADPTAADVPWDGIIDIGLGAGQNGINYDFGFIGQGLT